MSNLARNWQLVRHTEGALRAGSENLGSVPGLLRALLEEEAWREFSLPSGESVTYRRFSEFVAANPPRGLGTELAVIERVIGTDDPDLLVMLREAEKVGGGRPRKGEIPSDSNGISTGDDSGYTAARLARDAPNVYAAVKAGELSVNAAAVLAGIRPRRISVRLDAPDSVARSLRKHMDPEQLTRLRSLLDES
jgi:hypothetical protein